MFAASVIVCAALSSGEPDMNRCMAMNDIYGLFKTEENCRIRTNEMREFTISPPIIGDVLSMIGFPENYVLFELCLPVEEAGEAA